VTKETHPTSSITSPLYTVRSWYYVISGLTIGFGSWFCFLPSWQPPCLASLPVSRVLCWVGVVRWCPISPIGVSPLLPLLVLHPPIRPLHTPLPFSIASIKSSECRGHRALACFCLVLTNCSRYCVSQEVRSRPLPHHSFVAGARARGGVRCARIQHRMCRDSRPCARPALGPTAYGVVAQHHLRTELRLSPGSACGFTAAGGGGSGRVHSTPQP
jgi:hypothetical protein